MSDTTTSTPAPAPRLFPVTLGGKVANFYKLVKVIKATKKAKETAKKENKPEPTDRQQTDLYPYVGNLDEVLNFVGAWFLEAEAQKSGSFVELFNRCIGRFAHDVTEKSYFTAADGKVKIDDVKLAKLWGSVAEGVKSISTLKEDRNALMAEVLEYYQLAEQGAEAITTAGFLDRAAVLLVISNKSAELNQLSVVIEAREKAKEEKEKKEAAAEAAASVQPAKV